MPETSEPTKTMDTRSLRLLIATGLVAAIAGYVIALADWGGGTGQFGWLLLLAGLGMLVVVAMYRIWKVSGGIDASKLRRGGAPPGEDPAEEAEAPRQSRAG
jgi:hypothetical protein